MKITLKDGSILEFEKGTSVGDVALAISEGLFRNAICGKVNGELVDTYKVLESLKTAVYNGADEVYLGVNDFNARNNIDGFSLQNALAWTLSGGVFIGAFFMATDYVTSPSTPLGKIIFGVFAGLITVVIRFYGGYPEGVSFGILLANIINPYIENIGSKKVFGGAKA